jgi:hypothetical protein
MIAKFQIVIRYNSGGNIAANIRFDTATNLISGLGLTQNNMSVFFTFRFFNLSGASFVSFSIAGLTPPGTGVTLYNSGSSDIANSEDLCVLRRTSATTVEINVLSPAT